LDKKQLSVDVGTQKKFPLCDGSHKKIVGDDLGPITISTDERHEATHNIIITGKEFTEPDYK